MSSHDVTYPMNVHFCRSPNANEFDSIILTDAEITSVIAVSPSNSPTSNRKSRLFKVGVQPKYLEQIRSLSKIIEGRPASSRILKWRPGDLIRFLSTRTWGRQIDPCVMCIENIQHF